MPEEPKMLSMAFVVEVVEPVDDRSRVHLRYLIDNSAELFIAREWWEQLGAPEQLEVSVRPNPE